jgi:hypothetical protein
VVDGVVTDVAIEYDLPGALSDLGGRDPPGSGHTPLTISSAYT